MLMRSIFVFLLGSIFWWGCEEIPPTINPGNNAVSNDSLNFDEQPKKVLIEEFTGIKCVNCPPGTQAIKGLKEIYGQQLVVVSIHAGSFANPYPESQYDFRTKDGNDLFSFLGSPFGYPSAIVNRKIFPGENRLQTGRNKWPDFIAQETALPPSINLSIESDFDALTRIINLTVGIKFLESFPEEEPLKLSVLIAENGVQDLQLTPDGIQEDYQHDYILRDYISASNGDLVQGAKTESTILQFDYNGTIADEWIAKNCYLVAFVSQTGSENTVIQAHEVTLVK